MLFYKILELIRVAESCNVSLAMRFPITIKTETVRLGLGLGSFTTVVSFCPSAFLKSKFSFVGSQWVNFNCDR